MIDVLNLKQHNSGKDMIDINKINFEKMDGIIPAIVQDYYSMEILTIGFMNKEALEKTLSERLVIFYSRSKKTLWTKGEASGNYLSVVECVVDCDNDSLLIYAKSHGPTCHNGDISCFKADNLPPFLQFHKMIEVINDRYKNPKDNSYITKIANEGTKRIAQKVGEEGVEVALAAVDGDDNELANEATDLLFHLFVLLRDKQLNFEEITNIIKDRMNKLVNNS